MTTKLILIEGIPGSGKTTYAKKIARWYEERGIIANLYTEGQLHPADLGWCACISSNIYDEILAKYSSLEEEIARNTVIEGDYAIVAYTMIRTENKDFYKEMEGFEVYVGRIDDETFFKLHYDRWKSFGKRMADKDELNIFECAFLQNHVNELLF